MNLSDERRAFGNSRHDFHRAATNSVTNIPSHQRRQFTTLKGKRSNSKDRPPNFDSSKREHQRIQPLSMDANGVLNCHSHCPGEENLNESEALDHDQALIISELYRSQSGSSGSRTLDLPKLRLQRRFKPLMPGICGDAQFFIMNYRNQWSGPSHPEVLCGQHS